MVMPHSTIETTCPGELVRTFECPACGFVLESSYNGRGGRVLVVGDSDVEHTGSDGWRVLARR